MVSREMRVPLHGLLTVAFGIQIKFLEIDDGVVTIRITAPDGTPVRANWIKAISKAFRRSMAEELRQ